MVKRKSNPGSPEAPKKIMEVAQERVYVPLEDELRAHDVEGLPVRQNRAVGDAYGSAAGVAPAHEDETPSNGPSMEQIFGPGGFLHDP